MMTKEQRTKNTQLFQEITSRTKRMDLVTRSYEYTQDFYSKKRPKDCNALIKTQALHDWNLHIDALYVNDKTVSELFGKAAFETIDELDAFIKRHLLSGVPTSKKEDASERLFLEIQYGGLMFAASTSLMESNSLGKEKIKPSFKTAITFFPTDDGVGISEVLTLQSLSKMKGGSVDLSGVNKEVRQISHHILLSFNEELNLYQARSLDYQIKLPSRFREHFQDYPLLQILTRPQNIYKPPVTQENRISTLTKSFLSMFFVSDDTVLTKMEKVEFLESIKSIGFEIERQMTRLSQCKHRTTFKAAEENKKSVVILQSKVIALADSTSALEKKYGVCQVDFNNEKKQYDTFFNSKRSQLVSQSERLDQLYSTAYQTEVAHIETGLTEQKALLRLYTDLPEGILHKQFATETVGNLTAYIRLAEQKLIELKGSVVSKSHLQQDATFEMIHKAIEQLDDIQAWFDSQMTGYVDYFNAGEETDHPCRTLYVNLKDLCRNEEIYQDHSQQEASLYFLKMHLLELAGFMVHSTFCSANSMTSVDEYKLLQKNKTELSDFLSNLFLEIDQYIKRPRTLLKRNASHSLTLCEEEYKRQLEMFSDKRSSLESLISQVAYKTERLIDTEPQDATHDLLSHSALVMPDQLIQEIQLLNSKYLQYCKAQVKEKVRGYAYPKAAKLTWRNYLEEAKQFMYDINTLTTVRDLKDKVLNEIDGLEQGGYLTALNDAFSTFHVEEEITLVVRPS